jgi:hypothetical protein
MNKLYWLSTAAIFATLTSHAVAQNATDSASASSESSPALKFDNDSWRARQAPASLGLRPYSGGTKEGIHLPFGLNYNSEAKSLIMPLGEKSDWGVGINLNVNSSRAIELAPSSSLGLQPKRTPGVTLQKKF